MQFLEEYIKKRSEKNSNFSKEYQNQGLILETQLQKHLNTKQTMTNIMVFLIERNKTNAIRKNDNFRIY